MKKNKNGFTLIELLVVVLIIGILAAVAVPQYQKAVEKSRLAQVWTSISALQKAATAYALETGGTGETANPKEDYTIDLGYTYSGNFCSTLDCSVPCPSHAWGSCGLRFDCACGPCKANFFIQDEGDTAELWMDETGAKHCSGTLCSRFGLQNESGCHGF